QGGRDRHRPGHGEEACRERGWPGVGRIAGRPRGDVSLHLAQGTGAVMSARPLNIVLVEDDDVDVMNVRRAFEKARIHTSVLRAADGVEALDLLRNPSTPSERRLVLLDLNLPRMNGIEFLRELRADEVLRRTPVVVLTTSNDEQDKEDAFGMNVAGYLLKPVAFGNFVELMSALDRYWTQAEMP